MIKHDFKFAIYSAPVYRIDPFVQSLRSAARQHLRLPVSEEKGCLFKLWISSTALTTNWVIIHSDKFLPCQIQLGYVSCMTTAASIMLTFNCGKITQWKSRYLLVAFYVFMRSCDLLHNMLLYCLLVITGVFLLRTSVKNVDQVVGLNGRG